MIRVANSGEQHRQRGRSTTCKAKDSSDNMWRKLVQPGTLHGTATAEVSSKKNASRRTRSQEVRRVNYAAGDRPTDRRPTDRPKHHPEPATRLAENGTGRTELQRLTTNTTGSTQLLSSNTLAQFGQCNLSWGPRLLHCQNGTRAKAGGLHFPVQQLPPSLASSAADPCSFIQGAAPFGGLQLGLAAQVARPVVPTSMADFWSDRRLSRIHLYICLLRPGCRQTAGVAFAWDRGGATDTP